MRGILGARRYKMLFAPVKASREILVQSKVRSLQDMEGGEKNTLKAVKSMKYKVGKKLSRGTRFACT
jgi:hypothetical protein